ncbi:hypothetical protein C8R47DRAFT_1229888 [Mycena vitilis]|nr:hypothetical protein C8R47DRAFT_1229888 [Mycena vitilis]
MQLAREARRVLGMGGSAASGYEEQELDASDPDCDIPNELQAILSSCGQSPIDDTLSFRPPSVHAQLPPPGLPPHLPLPGSPSPSPTESHSNRSSFDSILDEEQRSSMEDSLFEKTGHRSSMSGDSVFGDPNPYDHYRAPHGHLLPPNHFRPLSVLSFNNDHSPMKEDDTRIQMLGGGHVRRKSIGSMYDASPLTAEASIASTSSSKFGGERMIRATQGLLVRHSLEDTALQAEGEDLSVFRPAAVFFRPSPNSRSRSSTVTTSSSGAETPPLSPAEGSSMSDGSMSSTDIVMSQVNVMLSNATHPMSSTARDRVRARARGQGHRRRGSAAQTRVPPSTRPSRRSSPALLPLSAPKRALAPPRIKAGSMDLSTGWDDERGIIALRRYYALRHEADDAVTESRRQFLDTPFFLYALQAFSPPKNPEGMQALLQHSVQNYGPLPSELGPRRVRSRTSSRASPYPRQGLIPASPDQQRSSPAALHRLASSPLRPLEVNPNVDVHMSPVVLSPKRENAWGLAPNARPRVASATRRTALGWTRRSTKASTDLKENNNQHRPQVRRRHRARDARAHEQARVDGKAARHEARDTGASQKTVLP